MRDVITRSDKAPYNEIELLSGWELSPLNPHSGQPVRHFASISEMIAYAHSESPASKVLIRQLAVNHNLVILDAKALGDYTQSVVRATIQVLAEEGAIDPEVAERIQANMIELFEVGIPLRVVGEDEDETQGMTSDGCTGDPDNCPVCGDYDDPAPDVPEAFLGWDLS